MRPRRALAFAAVLLVAAACNGDGGDAVTAEPTSTAASVSTVPTAPTGSTAQTAPTGASGLTAPTGSSGLTAPTGPTDAPGFIEPDPSNDACQVLTEKVAEPVVGVDLGVVSDVAVGKHSSCVLRNPEDTTSVELRLTPGPDAKDEFESLYASVEGANGVRKLPGLGDEAFRAFAANDAHVLVPLDQTLVRLSIADSDGALTEESLALAVSLVDRL